MTRVTLGKSRVREIRLPESVRAKAIWLSYSTTTRNPLSNRRAGIAPTIGSLGCDPRFSSTSAPAWLRPWSRRAGAAVHRARAIRSMHKFVSPTRRCQIRDCCFGMIDITSQVATLSQAGPPYRCFSAHNGRGIAPGVRRRSRIHPPIRLQPINDGRSGWEYQRRPYRRAGQALTRQRINLSNLREPSRQQVSELDGGRPSERDAKIALNLHHQQAAQSRLCIPSPATLNLSSLR
ncbi:hypothetical protein EOW77_0035255 [Bradyrhizobium yuanmingense]|nr:hypothetical protein EOW77_0035255 [Bradyrhizobium yuanmingense]